MNFNLLDILSLAYIAFSIYRGRRNGLAAELPGLISITAALVAGGGLFHWSERLVEKTATFAGESGGLTTFLGVVIATVVLWRYFQARIRQWAEQRFLDDNLRRRGGMVAGGLRSFGLCALVMVLASTLPIGVLRKPFTTGSFIGRIVMATIRPAYAAAHGK